VYLANYIELLRINSTGQTTKIVEEYLFDEIKIQNIKDNNICRVYFDYQPGQTH